MFAQKQPTSMNEYMEQHLANTPRIHELLPYESYCPATQLFFNRDTTGFVLIANPIVGASLKDQEKIAQFLRSNPYIKEGVSLQVLLFASPHIGTSLDHWLNVRQETMNNNPLIQKWSMRRYEFLKDKAYYDDENLVIRDFRILISYTTPSQITDIEEQQRLIGFRKELQTFLQGLGLPTAIVDAQNFISEVGSILNIGQKSIYRYDGQYQSQDPISQQLVDPSTTVIVQDEQLLINNAAILSRSYTPGKKPQYWSLAFMDRLIGDLLEQQSIGCPYLLHYGFFVNSNQKLAKVKAQTKREALERSLKSSLSKFMPTLPEQHAEAVEIDQELLTGGQVITASLSVTLFSSPDKIHDHEQTLKSVWTDGGWGLKAAAKDHFAVMLASLPMSFTLGSKYNVLGQKKAYGMATGLLRTSKAYTTVTKEAQNLMPLVAEWKGQDVPGIPLVGRRGQSFFWNPFNKMLLNHNAKQDILYNYNVCIAGIPGSGKSFFLLELMKTVMDSGGKAMVLDLGRSFEKTCKVLGGRHIEFSIRTPLSLNPFTHIPTGNTIDEVEARDELLALIGPLLQVMAAPQQGTTDLENSFIDYVIRKCWAEHGTNCNIDHICQYLTNHENQVARDLGQKLSLFSTMGSYGKFFNSPANTNLTEDLIVVETDDLRATPDLLAVVVQMLVMHINQQMIKSDRKRPFIILIDEAWKLLLGKNMNRFITEATRIARKYRGSIVCATQHLTDYFKSESPGATEAFNCASWKIILKQEDDVITALESHPQLKSFVDSEYKHNLLSSINSKPPHYSEGALFGPDVRGIVARLRVDNFTRLLYSTNPQEYHAIQTRLQQGMSIEAAIEDIIKIQQLERTYT